MSKPIDAIARGKVIFNVDLLIAKTLSVPTNALRLVWPFAACIPVSMPLFALTMSFEISTRVGPPVASKICSTIFALSTTLETAVAFEQAPVPYHKNPLHAVNTKVAFRIFFRLVAIVSL